MFRGGVKFTDLNDEEGKIVCLKYIASISTLTKKKALMNLIESI